LKRAERLSRGLNRLSRQRKVAGFNKAAGIANILAFLPLAAQAASATGAGVSELFDLGGQASTRQDQMQEAMRTVLRERQRQAREAQKLAELRQVNMQRITMMNPELAKQLMAGRVLPQGATVIGGTPRMDLLGQVADSMSRGEFSAPATEEPFP
jgi:hypothetical protein